MKFTDESIKKYSLIKSDDKKPCCKCGEPTEYIEFCYELRLCSKECLQEINDEFYARFEGVKRKKRYTRKIV